MIAYTAINDLVADSIEADWGLVRNANKILARQANINESTLKGIRQRKNAPNLQTTLQLAPHVPTLRQRLGELLGIGQPASSEAKRIQLAIQALRGEHDDTIERMYQPQPEVQASLPLH